MVFWNLALLFKIPFTIIFLNLEKRGYQNWEAQRKQGEIFLEKTQLKMPIETILCILPWGEEYKVKSQVWKKIVDVDDLVSHLFCVDSIKTRNMKYILVWQSVSDTFLVMTS